MERITALVIVFDQGNTLILDPFAQVMEKQKDQFSQVCQCHGILLSASQIVNIWAESNKEVNFPHIGHFYQEEPIVQHALQKLGVAEKIAAILALELLREYRVGLREVILSDPRTREVRDTLRELKSLGKRLGIFSNDRIVGLGFVLSIMQVRPFFEYVETSESLGIEKPHPGVFQHILSHFGVPPDQLIYVGDDPIRDIEAAKKQGLKAIQYLVDVDRYCEPWRDYGKISENQPDATIDHFSALLDVLG